MADNGLQSSGQTAAAAVTAPPPASSCATAANPNIMTETNRGQDSLTSADYYFNSYAHFGIHEEMLKDEVRTTSYRNAIIRNKHLFEGRTVLDVGCGTGVLSMFCAQAGAAHVYAVECSDIIEYAYEIVKLNNFDHVITLLKGKVEDITLPVEKVDIIVSEWMGYFLLYESMLDTVIFARDKWLRPGGLMFPDKATMYMVGIEDGSYKDEKIEWWNNVYGFNMSPLRHVAIKEPLVDTVENNAVITYPVAIMQLDVQTVTKEQLLLDLPFRLQFSRDDYLHAFVVYFDIQFSLCHKPICFSTGPHSRYTHWKQTVLYLENALVVRRGEFVEGRLRCRPNGKNPRDLDIGLDYSWTGEHGTCTGSQEYKMR
eukprot:gnl/Spiro4/8227_TR4349_c0_g1_i1.p1 gnl/Spiro4/8227_TR4349_c0_g1~~gnl/Spiro4/8227_TR4349_c0_g1_i1.p1  ORF type:complete len:370 (+),score=62.12 gnl/Spiro4/8227_TR4349_c0_g1_i1:39-1148(+)